jgi:hypothetical protein
VAPLIAAQWAELRCAGRTVGQSPEGLPVVWRLVDPMVVPPTAARMAEQPFAEHTEGQPSLRAAFTVPTTAPGPSQRVSQLGRRPVPRRLRPIATTRLIATQHRTTIHRPGRVGKGNTAGCLGAYGMLDWRVPGWAKIGGALCLR